MTDIGDAVTVETYIRVNDTFADPGSVTIEVSPPDGTAFSPAVIHPSVGLYQAIVKATSAGRWRYTWTTSTPDGVEHGYFDVLSDPPPPARPDPLVTLAELEDRLGRDLSPEEARRAEALLADASALIRAYTGQSFDLVRGDVVQLTALGRVLELPQRPVLAVTSVTAVGCDGLPDFPLAGWCWDGDTTIDMCAIDPNVWVSLPAWWWDSGCGCSYKVTYDHGYAVTPPDIVAIVCGMVNRVLVAPSMVEGMLSERVGPFGYTLQQGSSGTPGPSVRLTQADRDALASAGYRRTAGTIQLRA